MANTSLTSVNDILKRLYPDNVSDANFKSYPALAMMKKSHFVSTGGQGHVVPIVLSYGAGASHTFSSAQSYTYPATYKGFLVTTTKDYVVRRIEGEALAHAQGDRMALLELISSNTEDAFALANKKMGWQLFRDGNAYIGAVGTSGITTTSLTLSVPTDIHNFEVGMEVVAASTAAGSIRSGSATITGINIGTYTLTTDSNWASQITSIADADYLYAIGDAPNGGTAAGLKGFDAWIPSVAATDTFFGVARTGLSKLSGLRYDASGYSSVRECLIRGQHYMNTNITNGGIDTCFVHPNVYRQLLLEMDGKENITRQAQSLKGPVEFGFNGFRLIGDKGPIDIFADINCQPTVAWMLSWGDWKLLSAGGEAPRLIQHGDKLINVYNEDTAEMRIGHYSQVACFNTSRQGRVTMPAFS